MKEETIKKYSREERLKFMYDLFTKNNKNRKVLEFFDNYDNLRKYKYVETENKQI